MNTADCIDIIATYSRAQALEDGTLVTLDQKLCAEAGYRYPVAATRRVYETAIAMTPAAKRACNDVEGRTWDVLHMARMGMRRAPAGSSCLFRVYAVVARVRPTLLTLRITCGPGDDGEPVLTIGYPEED